MSQAGLGAVDRWLLAIATWQESAEDLPLLSDEEWHELLRRAGDFGLAPMLLRFIGALRGAVPALVTDQLAALSRGHAVRWLSQQQELAALADRFEAEGLRFVALKGVALALDLYPRPELRTMRDLDLLMTEGDAAQAHRLLVEDGYSVPDGIIAKPLEMSHQHPVLRSPETGVLVELHKGLIASGWPEGERLASAILADHRTVTCLARTIGVPDKTHLFVHLLAHATRNRPFDTGPQFLADYSLLRDAVDTDTELFAAYGVERARSLADAMLARHGDADLDRRADAALALLLLDDADERERKLLIRSGGASTDPRWALHKLVDPTPDALAQLSGRSVEDPLRWLAYPRWVVSRARHFFTARRSGGLVGQVREAAALRDWLVADEPSG